ncbi:MAG: MFS transporter [Acidipropionibacterium sp.]|jgi:MFS family permease|nr:MFS transporter [Acidipropionibacterium sp.]
MSDPSRQRSLAPVAVWLSVSALSNLGDSTWSFSLNWVASGLGGAYAGVLNAVYTGILSGFVIFGGVIGDRIGQKRLMAYSLAGSVIVLVGFAGFQVSGANLAVLLIIRAVLNAAIAGLRAPSQTVFIRQLAPPEKVPRLMSVSSSLSIVMRLLGPAVGGAIIALSGISASAIFNAASFTVVLIALLWIRPAYPPPPTVKRSGWRDIVDAVAKLRGLPEIVAMLITLCCVAGAFLPVTSLCLPLLAHAHGWSPSQGSVLVMASSAGMLLVSGVLSVAGPYHRPGVPMGAGIVITAVSLIVMAVGPSLVVDAVASFVSGVGICLVTLHMSPLFVLKTPSDMQSRFASLLTLGQMLPTFITTPILGLISQRISVKAALLGCAVIGSMGLVPVLASSPLRRATLPRVKRAAR